ASKAGGAAVYDTLLGLLTDGEALFAYLIAVSGAGQKVPDDPRRTQRGARLLNAIGEVLSDIGSAAGDARWERLGEPQARLRRLARRLEGALLEPVKLQSGFELVDFAPREVHVETWSACVARYTARSWSTLKA